MTGEGRERDLRKININGEKEEINAVTRSEGEGIRDRSGNQKGNRSVVQIVRVAVTVALKVKVLLLNIRGQSVKIILKKLLK